MSYINVETLLDHELHKIEEGLPLLEDLCPSALVPFKARKLRNVAIAWINERWFLERGLDIFNSEVRRRVESWLVLEFGYVVPRDEDSLTNYENDWKTFYADRYGSSGPTAHGGSGRAGISRCFQTKGIGVTPLVGNTSAWTYSHGCMWLEEALREAIYSELANAEFPYGAVPVLAVMDTGQRCLMPSGAWGERRAIMLRPVVLRPAHLERATLFRPSGGTDLYHYADVARVRDIVHLLESDIVSQSGSVTNADSIEEIFLRIAEQVAFGRAHRLFHGAYFSSNISMRGELLDFGAFRALPDWSRVYTSDHTAGFGNEIIQLRSAVKSIAFYHRKYKSVLSSEINAEALISKIDAQIQRSFDRECLRIWNIEPNRPIGQVIIALMRDYYSHQQKLPISYERGFRSTQGWLFPTASEELSEAHEESISNRLRNNIAQIIGEHFQQEPNGFAAAELSINVANRLLRPRPELERELLQFELYDAIGGQTSGRSIDSGIIFEAIRNRLSCGRRHWPRLPGGAKVLAQICYGHSSALLCEHVIDKVKFIWIEVIKVGDQICIFGSWISVSAVESYCSGSDSISWCGSFNIENSMDCRSGEIYLDPLVGAFIPAFKLWYLNEYMP